MSLLDRFLSCVGLFFIAAILCHTILFVAFYARSSDLQQYRHGGDETWAIVTGGGGGIGFGYSQELCRQGFGVVLVGHLKSELEQAERKILQETPSAKIRHVILDASKADYTQIENSVSEISKLHVTILINNVGGHGYVFTEAMKDFPHYTPEEIDSVLNMNTRFMVYLTRILLPTLTRTNKPSLIINMSSAARFGMPYNALYSATKAFIAIFTKALARELRAEGYKNLKVTAVIPTDVRSQVHTIPLSWSVPTSAEYAQVVLGKVGGASDIVIPYWRQAILVLTGEVTPDWIIERFVVKRARVLKEYFSRSR